MLEEHLRAIPFLRDVPGPTLAAAAARMRAVEHPRGATVYAAGDVADTLAIVDRGWLEVLDPGDGRPLATLGPGSVVGELGVLLDAARGATVRAMTAVSLWQLHRDDVQALVGEDPSLAVAFSREIGRRLLAANKVVAAEPATVTVVTEDDASALLDALVREAVERIGVLPLEDDEGVPARVAARRGVTQLDGSGVEPADLVALASRTSGEHAVVIIVLPRTPSRLAAAAAAAADFGVELRGSLPRDVADRLGPRRRLRGGGDEASRARIARWVSGRAIGLALSSGGSKTTAHIGVVRVLQEAGVTIDAVAGTSGGAVVAAAVAVSAPADEIERRAHELREAFRVVRLGVMIPPRSALFRGTGPAARFRAWYGDRRIEECTIPLFLVAAALSSGEEVVIDEGPVVDGLRASTAIPAILEPRRWRGTLLVDGGIVSPLPAGVLRDAGIRRIIGSNVAGQELVVTGEGSTPSLLETMARTMSMMERQVLATQVGLVDVHIRPVVRAANSFDFSTIPQFVAEGERAARHERDALHELVANDRTAGPVVKAG